MLKLHQIIGYLTLAGMVTQGFLGGKLYNNWERGLYRTHKTVGNITTLSYFTGAGLSLFSPPPLTNKKYKGLNSIKAHKYLASIHFSAMVATGIFKNRNIKIHKYTNCNLGLEIKLEDGYIFPSEITPEGRNRMKVEDYIRGIK